MGDMSITARVYVAGDEGDMFENNVLVFLPIYVYYQPMLMTVTMKEAWAM